MLSVLHHSRDEIVLEVIYRMLNLVSVA